MNLFSQLVVSVLAVTNIAFAAALVVQDQQWQLFDPAQAQLLLLFPMLSIVVLVVRQLVGVRTYGLFAPLIFGFSLLSVNLWHGLYIYIPLVVGGICIDFLLRNHFPQHVARTTIVLHILMILMLIGLEQTTVDVGIFIASVPYIVFIYLVDSFNRLQESIDTKTAIVVLVNTIIVSIMVYAFGVVALAFIPSAMWEVAFGYSLVLSILFAIYRGPRLMEWFRFKPLRQSEETKKSGFGFSVESFMGMNYRGGALVHQYNAPAAIRLVKDKIATKKRLVAHNIDTPELYATIVNPQDITKTLTSVPVPFVLKPAHGGGGNGIILVEKRTKDNKFITTSKQTYTLEEMVEHCRMTIEGQMSNTGAGDIVLIEEKIISHHAFDRLCAHGLPDIRVLVFEGKAVMAMLRIPTKYSDGKANLTLGALGAGVNIDTGRIFRVYDKKQGEVKDSEFLGITIPYWDKVVSLAESSALATGLGFAGSDIIMTNNGPTVIEVNARPGIEIQNVCAQNIYNLISQE